MLVFLRSIEENLRLWNEMIQGTEVGVKTCLRAKIDYKNPNGALRDPVLYRCKPEHHVQYVRLLLVLVPLVLNFSHSIMLTRMHRTVSGLARSIRCTQPMTSLAQSSTALRESLTHCARLSIMTVMHR
jgi:hypothetical protein